MQLKLSANFKIFSSLNMLTIVVVKPEFWDNKVNTMVVDALVPCIARSSATMALTVNDGRAISFHKELFQLPPPLCVEK